MLRVQRLAEHEPGLRQRALGGVHEQHDAVDHRQAALDLATEVGVAGGVDDVDDHLLALGRRALVVHGGVLGEDRDALLALEVTGVHGALVDVLVLAESAGLVQHRVHEGRLAVVDVRDDGDVPEVLAGDLLGHTGAVVRFRVEVCGGRALWPRSQPQRDDVAERPPESIGGDGPGRIVVRRPARPSYGARSSRGTAAADRACCRMGRMDYVKLGRTGLEVSRLCLGCMTYGEPDRGNHAWTLGEEESRPLIKQAARPRHQLLRHRQRLLRRHERGDRRPGAAATSRGATRW